MIYNKFYEKHNKELSNYSKNIRYKAFNLAIKRGGVYYKKIVLFKFILMIILSVVNSVLLNIGMWGLLNIIPLWIIFEFSIYKEKCEYALPLLQQAAKDVSKFPNLI
jgi:hypothetical protein